jgi:hypothetical protein
MLALLALLAAFALPIAAQAQTEIVPTYRVVPHHHHWHHHHHHWHRHVGYHSNGTVVPQAARS